MSDKVLDLIIAFACGVTVVGTAILAYSLMDWELFP